MNGAVCAYRRSCTRISACPDVPALDDVLLGPVGALALALVVGWVVGRIALRVIQILWDAHVKADADVLGQRDASIKRLEEVIGLVKKAKQ